MDDKQWTVQTVLWAVYVTCSIVGYIDNANEWSLGLLVLASLILPGALLRYTQFKDAWLAKLLWVSLTTVVLVLFGFCAYTEPARWGLSWAHKAGALFYLVAVVYPHYQHYQHYQNDKQQHSEKPKLKAKSYFLAIVWILFALYTSMALLLAISGQPWAWGLWASTIVTQIATALFFKSMKDKNTSKGVHHEGNAAVVVLFYAFMVMLFGAYLGGTEVVEDSPADGTRAYAWTGTIAVTLSVIVTHLWAKEDMHSSAMQTVNNLVF